MIDVKEALLELKDSLIKVIKITGNTIDNLSRPLYLVTCDKYDIKGWDRDKIFDYGKGWSQLKKDAMGADRLNLSDPIKMVSNISTCEITETSLLELNKDLSTVQINILAEYAKFIRTHNFAPSFSIFKRYCTCASKIRDFYKNIDELDDDYRQYFPYESSINLCDKKSWTEKYRKDFYAELEKHKMFIFVSVGSFCTVDFNFLSSLKEYANACNAMIIGLPMFKRYDKALLDFCVSPAVRDYMWIAFEDIVLNNNLMVQILKANCTSKSTLIGLNQLVSKYDTSIIVAGINQQLKYIPVLKDKTPNMIASTGCCTEYEPVKKDEILRIPTKAEKLAKERLSIKGGLIVELFDEELFSVRNIEADNTGAFYDLLWHCHPSHSEPTGDGKVFVIGDLHAPKHNEILLDANIRAIEKFGCDTVVLHDSVNMSYISHHNVDKAITRAQIAEEGNANILKEIESFANILNELCNTPGVKRVIIPYSNHPAHFEKFIQDMGRMSKDDINLRTSLQVALAMLDNKNVLQFMTEELVGYKNDKIEWLREDEGKEIYGVQVGLHGCEKVNGGKMTPTSTNNAFKKTVLAHRHSAGIDGDTITVGIACEKEQGYNHGLSSWTESSAIVHPNGTVQLLTFVNVRGEYKVWP